MVNQVAYNTTYTIDFLKDGEHDPAREGLQGLQAVDQLLAPSRDLTRALLHAGSESFSRRRSGSKTGLGFTVTNCQPTLVTEIEGDAYPTAVCAEAVRLPSLTVRYFSRAGVPTMWAQLRTSSAPTSIDNVPNTNGDLSCGLRSVSNSSTMGRHDDGKNTNSSSASIVSYTPTVSKAGRSSPLAIR